MHRMQLQVSSVFYVWDLGTIATLHFYWFLLQKIKEVIFLFPMVFAFFLLCKPLHRTLLENLEASCSGFASSRYFQM